MISFSSVWLHFFSSCVLPTTIGSESTNCDDPYQWYTMHREIKFVMIPDGSSTAPAYSLWKTLLSRQTVSPSCPSFLGSLFCPHRVSAAGRGSGALAQPPLPHLMPFHLHGASGSVCAVELLGLTARSTLRGCRKPPRDKAAGQPTLLGQELLLCWSLASAGLA